MSPQEQQEHTERVRIYTSHRKHLDNSKFRKITKDESVTYQTIYTEPLPIDTRIPEKDKLSKSNFEKLSISHQLQELSHIKLHLSTLEQSYNLLLHGQPIEKILSI